VTADSNPAVAATRPAGSARPSPGHQDGPQRALVARLDSAGDVILAGPAVRALANAGLQVTMLCSHRGAAAAALLPGVADVVVFDAPWVLADPPPVRPGPVLRLLTHLRRRAYDEALVLTSFHQSPLPLALLLRLGGTRRVCAASEDYPGSLLDVRVRLDDDLHEAERSAAVAAAAGFPPDGAHLALRPDLPDVSHLLDGAATAPGAGAASARGRGRGADPPGRTARPYVVVHPGADAPARAWPSPLAHRAVRLLSARGLDVVVTGDPGERALTTFVAGDVGVNLGGRTTLAELAAVIRGAEALVAGNTGPAHLAAAVGTPVVSLFAPVVPARRWRPYGVPTVLLGDQDAACAGTRARTCPVEGHPCLASVSPEDVVAAVGSVRGVSK
jgi:ADP-heptose:LPS heptosyltransferase